MESHEDVLSEHPHIIGLILDEAAHTYKPGIPLQFVQIASKFRVGQVHPSNHSRDGSMGCRESEQPASLSERGVSLDNDGTVDPSLVEKRRQIRGQEIATQGVEFQRHPGIRESSHLPKVLMGINPFVLWMFASGLIQSTAREYWFVAII